MDVARRQLIYVTRDPSETLCARFEERAEPYIGYFYGNVNERGDVSHCPRKSSLFFLTILISLESYCMEIGLEDW
jgi:hypothetical protein